MKQLLVFVLMVCSLPVNGQKKRYSDVRNRWVSSGIHSANDCTYTRIRRYTTDTVIYGTTYHTMMDVSYHDSSMLCGRYTDSIANYYVREDTLAGYVYYRCPYTDTEEHVLYNYNLHVGDTIQYFPPNFYAPYMPVVTDSVFKIDSTLIDGVYHRVFFMRSSIPTYNFLTWNYVEGLGSLSGSYVPFHYGCTTDHELLSCFSQNGYVPDIHTTAYICINNTVMFNNGLKCSPTGIASILSSGSIHVMPNPANESISINSDEPLYGSAIMVYNSVGGLIYHSEAGLVKGNNVINTAAWKNGLYLIVIRNNDGSMKQERIVVIH